MLNAGTSKEEKEVIKLKKKNKQNTSEQIKQVLLDAREGIYKYL